MLVLTRRTGQSIIIGDGIEVVVSQVKGSGDQAQVRLGIVAPRGVRVLRREVFDAIAEENRLASATSSDSIGLLESISGNGQARENTSEQ
ncbi:MAG: carbon storage regulator [Ignavibacteriales bacterium]